VFPEPGRGGQLCPLDSMFPENGIAGYCDSTLSGIMISGDL